MSQKELSSWLKALVILSAIMGVVLCFWLAPIYGQKLAQIDPKLDYMYWPCLVFVWLGCVPVYAALYQAWKIFENIGRDQSFCEENVNRLKLVSKFSIVEIVLYFGASIFLLLIDLVHIQIFVVIFAILFASMFVAMSSATLSHLVKKAVVLQEENDLTI